MIRILMVLVLAALASPGLAQSSDKLGAGDTVNITVFQQPDLTTDTRITDTGSITMPLAGSVKVQGLTTAEAAAAIEKALKDGQFLKNPKVRVALTTVRSRQVNVLGLVVRPGRYPFESASMKMPELIAAAGGLAAGGWDQVTVIREGKPIRVNTLDKSFELQNGDTVQVERAPQFYIYGEVLRAGTYPVADNMSVMQALALGGGITPRGSEWRLKLRRANEKGKLVESSAKLQDRVRPDDVIIVKEALF